MRSALYYLGNSFVDSACELLHTLVMDRSEFIQKQKWFIVSIYNSNLVIMVHNSISAVVLSI